MLHLTHTGMYAGTPFCGCNRKKEEADGHRFVHVPYSRTAHFFKNNDICPKCKKIYDHPED